jgi:Tol biopolymer transport system component
MRGITVFVAAMLLSVAVFAVISNAYSDQTTRVSKSPAGLPANASASSGVISGDGRYVVFESNASNLVTEADGTPVSGTHVYRYDRNTGTTELVSRATTGRASTGVSRFPTVSSDGNYVAFASFANDLVTGASNPWMDVFRRDMTARTTALVSENVAHEPGNASSALSGLSGAREISDNGRYVVFTSFATNLVATGNNTVQQVYVKDMTDGAVVRASVNNAGETGTGNSQTPAISGDGTVVAFQSASLNLSANTPQIYTRKLPAGPTTLESAGAADVGRTSSAPSLSKNGNYVAFESAAALSPRDRDNGTIDVFLRDHDAGTTELASLSDNALSGAMSMGPSISADGRWVGFWSRDDQLIGVTSDTNGFDDVFVYDRQDKTVMRVSLNDAGDQTNGTSGGLLGGPSVSADGHLVLFGSLATNLVASATNSFNQLYVRNLSSNQAPVVNSGGDETVNEGTWLKRVGTFTDLDGSTSWTGTADYGTGSVPLIIDPDKKLWLFQVEPFAPGTYVVTISVTDNEGAKGTATFRHTVNNVDPTIVGLGGDETIYFGATLHRQVTLGDPGMNWPVPQPAETYSATVNFGDGTGKTALSGVVFTLDHTYANPGTYVVSFTAADSNGGSSSANLTVHVLNYSFQWLDPVGDMFVVGRNLPVKFTVRAPDGSFILDQSVHVAVYDTHGSGLVEYYFGDQPSRAVTASGGAYRVNVDTRDLAPGMYVLRVTFTSPTLVGVFDLPTNGTASATMKSGLR